jgi:FixJ family two-component response regulator
VTKACLLIAVVDDEEPVRKALMRLMRSAGLNAETFGSGAEFLKSLDTRLPDCVVLDLHMPRMDGFKVQAHLARKHAALPVIIMTGHDLPKAHERALEGGASAFLRKPVLDRILLGAISAATAGEQTKTNNQKTFSRTSSLNCRRTRVINGSTNPNRNFPSRSQQRPPESPQQCLGSPWEWPAQDNHKIKTKQPNENKN